MSKKIFMLAFILSIGLNVKAQQNQLKAVNNPNLEQKRLDAAKPKVAPQPRPKTDPMAMAKKYEETAIRKWKKEHPTVLTMSREKYNALPLAKKQEVNEKEVILYDQKIKWSDVEQYEKSK